MRFLAIVRVAAVFCTGLFAGILFGDRMGASFARPEMAASAFVQFQQIVHRNYVVMMPVLLFSAIILSLVWLFLARSQPKRAEFWLVAVATGAVIVVLAMTLAVSVPINNELMTWNIASPPANVMEIWAPWEKVHSLRTVLVMVAFLMEVVALAGVPSTTSSRSSQTA